MENLLSGSRRAKIWCRKERVSMSQEFSTNQCIQGSEYETFDAMET